MSTLKLTQVYFFTNFNDRLTAATVIVVVAAEREVMCVMSWSHYVLGTSWLYTSIASLIVTQTYVIAWKWK